MFPTSGKYSVVAYAVKSHYIILRWILGLVNGKCFASAHFKFCNVIYSFDYMAVKSENRIKFIFSYAEVILLVTIIISLLSLRKKKNKKQKVSI